MWVSGGDGADDTESTMNATRPFDFFNWIGWINEQVASGLTDEQIVAASPAWLRRDDGHNREALRSYLRLARAA